jgi:hypothetical protein
MNQREFILLCKELVAKVENDLTIVGIDAQYAESLYEREAEFSIRVKFKREPLLGPDRMTVAQ